MAIAELFGNFFKSEIKSSGSKLFAEKKISVPSGSDTSIHAYVRATPPLKVRLMAADISTETFTADCNCPVAKKNQFCKHVWATLLCVEEKYPDFLSGKTVIEKGSLALEAPTTRAERSEAAATSYREAAKIRAAGYRKEQYEKQKLRAKEWKGQRQKRDTSVDERASHPPEIRAALAYFSSNGFPMATGPSETLLGEAKRKLSRVFHPDKGGSNDEIVELNRNCELLQRFLQSTV